MTTKFMTRSEIIAEFRSKNLTAAAPPVMPPKMPESPAKNDASDAEPADATDDATDSAISELEAALKKVQDAQASDPDDATDPNDKKVDAVVAQIATLIETLKTAQATDDEGDLPGTGDASDKTLPDEKMSVTNSTPDLESVDEDGNIKPHIECATQGCAHLASMHENTDNGDNTGKCTSPGCMCGEMSIANVGTPSDPEGDDADGSGDGGGPNNSGGDDTPPAGGGAHASLDAMPGPGMDMPSMPMPVAPTTPMAPADSNPAPNMTPAIGGTPFSIPVMVIEGQNTGDGRSIGIDALTWGAFPIPLMGMKTATHDPNGMDQNAPSVLCGHIDSIEKVSGESGTQILKAVGEFLDTDDGNDFADIVTKMGRVGVSADISVDESIETIADMDEFGYPIFSSTLTAGVLQGCTIVPFPAFSGAYITTTMDGTTPEIPQQVADAMPKMPDIVASGGQLIHYMASAECVPCSQGYELVASGAPVHPPLAWFMNPNFTDGDGRLKEIFTGRGEQRLGGSYACPLTITDDGRVFGHIAAWGVCHMGSPGACITPPRSKYNYAHFMRDGQRVRTAEGDDVTVGVLTFHTGHASTGRHVGASTAMSHYDNTGTAFADVMTGEDDYGIWVSGALRPNITDEQLREIRSASPSGDWREIGGNLELVAVLQVNQPGFPVAVVADGGRQVSLVAAGAYEMAQLVDDVFTDDVVANAYVDTGLRLALAPVLEGEKFRARQMRLEMKKRDVRARFAKARGSR